MVNRLRATGESTRLRIISILASGELTVTELSQVLVQSQPRISRHLRLLLEAGLVERLPEGNSVFYRLSDGPQPLGVSDVAHMVLEGLDTNDRVLAADQRRLAAVKQLRQEEVRAYFEAHAAEWSRIRSLNQPIPEIEAAMVEILETDPIDLLVDLGTGTGRVLEVLSPVYQRGIGFDTNRAMLGVARVNLEQAGIHHAYVRYGDLWSLPEPADIADVVVMHQVLHYLENPRGAVGAAALLLKPGGRLLIVDFAPHDLEFLRTEHAHRRLGFSERDMARWCRDAGLNIEPVRRFKPLPAGRDAGKSLTTCLWVASRAAVIQTEELVHTTGVRREQT